MKELGLVVATPEGPSTQEFSFVVTADGVRRGQFVALETELGTTIALVKDLFRANRYFERPESVSVYEKNGGKAFMAELPTAEWEYVVAQCRVMGAWNEGFVRATYPPSPGTKVSEVELSMLKQFVGIDDKGLEFGKVLQHDLAARVSLNGLLQKHFGLLGKSGSGKSNAATVLVEELLDRPIENGRIAVVIFDVHGEYSCFGDKRANPQYASKTTVIDASKLQVALHKVSPGMLSEFMPDMSPAARRELSKLLFGLKKRMRTEQKAYSLRDVIASVEASDMDKNVKGPLVGWLSELKFLRLFGLADYPAVKELVKPGRLVVFDLSGLTDQKRKQVIVSYFAQKLFKFRQEEKIPPVLLIVEEAHNFAPNQVPKGAAIARSIINKIAREGRKFGCSICLVSQRPVQLSTTALSQLNTFLIFRVTNPYDIEHISQSCESIDSDLSGQITTLAVGEGILFGEAVNQPVFIQVRRRKTSQGRKGAGLEELAKKFEEGAKRQVSAEDVEAFV